MQSTRRTAIRNAQVAVACAAGVSLLLTTPPTTAATPTPSVATAGPASQVSTGAVNIPANVRLYRVRESQLGIHRWYRQYKGGHPVAGGWWALHRAAGGSVTVWDGRRNVAKVNTDQPTVTLSTASAAASKSTAVAVSDTTTTDLMVLPAGNTRSEARLVWAVSSADGAGARTSYVDAVTGNVLATVINAKFAEQPGKLRHGTARVFDPNPIQRLQDQSLRDRHDGKHAVPPHAYRTVTLPRLNGKGHTLRGRWVQVTNADVAVSATRTFSYNRSNDKFEQTMGYYAIDAEQAYLQRLGFTDVNAESQKIETNAFADDNSYYDPSTDQISMGRGGVDDAEDAEVTWHEYGHAIQDDQVPAWGSSYDGRAMGEAFGDYMAVTMSQRFADDTADAPTACVMDWDATSYTSGTPHCLRRTDRDKVYPDDLDPRHDPHADGEIWARALWDMNQALGRNRATTIIVEAQFWMNPRISFEDAAQVTIDTAELLYANPTVTTIVAQAFADRGFVDLPAKH